MNATIVFSLSFILNACGNAANKQNELLAARSVEDATREKFAGSVTPGQLAISTIISISSCLNSDYGFRSLVLVDDGQGCKSAATERSICGAAYWLRSKSFLGTSQQLLVSQLEINRAKKAQEKYWFLDGVGGAFHHLGGEGEDIYCIEVLSNHQLALKLLKQIRT